MPNDSQAGAGRPSTEDFLASLESAGILSEAALQEVRGALPGELGADDSAALAQWLVERGSLSEFQAHRLLVGKAQSLLFGRYLLVDRLGVGAMGRVFKARHRLMDRLVALKVVLPVCATSRHSVQRFFREMKIVGMLDHPNVVRAFDADEHEGSPYIVMEYLEGDDLERVLRRRSVLPVLEVVDYMAQAARGLAHAHERGVVHRDIKPTNLFLDKTGVVKVLDLGLGAFVGVSSEGVSPHDTDEGFVVGTSDYMSPEQLSGQPIDARTDLFSLGCAMYRLLTGTFAFPGTNKMDRMVMRMQEPHVPISDIRKNLPVPLVALVDGLLSLRPEDRFASADEVAEELEMLLPLSERRNRGARTGQAGRPIRALASPVHADAEKPLDWNLIESALQSRRESASEPSAPSRLAVDESPRPTVTQLDSHRRNLEQDGVETGRRVQQEYRKEVIQLKRSLAEERAQDPAAEAPTAMEHWLERLGEQIGDFLAEPSAGHIIVILVIITLIVAIGLAYSLS